MKQVRTFTAKPLLFLASDTTKLWEQETYFSCTKAGAPFSRNSNRRTSKDDNTV